MHKNETPSQLQAVVNTPETAFKGWIAIISSVFVITMLGFKVTNDIEANRKSNAEVKESVNEIEKAIYELKGIVEASLSRQDIHEQYGEHRNSKPDIDRIDRELFEIKTEIKAGNGNGP